MNSFDMSVQDKQLGIDSLLAELENTFYRDLTENSNPPSNTQYISLIKISSESKLEIVRELKREISLMRNN